VKKKKPIHPRLFIKADYFNKTKIILFYKSNKFNSDGSRLIEEDIFEEADLNSSFEDYLIEINKVEHAKLKKYIKIQKIVLEKREKTRNYDAVKIIKSSIEEMLNFKSDFESWFKLMKVEK
tara:strand:+ start:106 stop:468 length:363 start_codon:yes stop_codon:yes gene_type:complete